jgi:hypothetical protein
MSAETQGPATENRPTDEQSPPEEGATVRRTASEGGALVLWDGVSPGGLMIGGEVYFPPGCTPEEEAAIWEAEFRRWDGVDAWAATLKARQTDHS